MTAHAVHPAKVRGHAGSFAMLPLVLLAAFVLAAGSFVAYVLWPSWPGARVALDAPAIPVTVSGVLFNVPPAAIRAAVQRHPGPHERIDLALLWPSLQPPQADDRAEVKSVEATGDTATASAAEQAEASGRLFVTILPLGSVLPPIERLRSIYPRYVEAQASAGPDGLAILPFRAGTPYEGEDLVYDGAAAERFFARCTRPAGIVPGTCIHEQAFATAEMTLRFPRQWLDQWQSVAAGFERLAAQLHP